MADRFSYVATAEDRTNAELLAVQIANDVWALFAGAGLSKPCGLPLAPDLVADIENALGLRPNELDRNDLALACTRFQIAHGNTALFEFLRRKLDTSRCAPSSAHHKLVALGPKDILTTNPEDLWEKTLDADDIAHCVIVQGPDWAHWSPAVRSLIKLHGDFSRPDSLVFSEQDYARYPKDDVIRGSLRDRIARLSFFFVGYRVADRNLQHEFQWVQDRIGSGAKPHFLLTDTIEPWQREHFAQRNVRVIAIGNYARLGQFLDDLASLVNSLRPIPKVGTAASLGLIPPALGHAALVGLFHDRYEAVRAASGQWRLVAAEDLVRRLLLDVEQAEQRSPEIVAELADFRQQLQLALANIMYWRGRTGDARALWEQARSTQLSAARRLQAALVAANLSDANALEELLREPLPDTPDLLLLRIVLESLRGNFDGVLRLAPAEPPGLDVAILTARALLQTLSETSVITTYRMLDTAWTQAHGSPTGMAQVAEYTEDLLRRVISAGWQVPELDRRDLLTTIRRRYREAIECADSISQEFPEIVVEVLAAAMDFHRYLHEDEELNRFRTRLEEMRAVGRRYPTTEYLIGNQVAEAETIEQLYRDGHLTASQRAALVSRLYASEKQPERAEDVLRDALAVVDNEDDRLALLETLVELLVEQRKFSEAESLLLPQKVPSEFLALMNAIIIHRQHGRQAAIERLRTAAAEHPRDRMILQNLVRLLAAEAQDRRRRRQARSD